MLSCRSVLKYYYINILSVIPNVYTHMFQRFEKDNIIIDRVSRYNAKRTNLESAVSFLMVAAIFLSKVKADE